MIEENYETSPHKKNLITVEEFALHYYKMSEHSPYMICYVYWMRKKFPDLPIVWPSVFLKNNFHFLLEWPDMKMIISWLSDDEKTAIAAYLKTESAANRKFVTEFAKHSEAFDYESVLQQIDQLSKKSK